MSDSYTRKFQIKWMRRSCAELGIAVPKNANRSQLQAVLDAYFKNAGVVYTDGGVGLRQTDIPTGEYTIHFSISGIHTIRAESADAACKWIIENADECFTPSFGTIEDMYDYEIHQVYSMNDED